MPIERFEEFSLTLGIAGLIRYMIFVVYRRGKESNAGQSGGFFVPLGLDGVGSSATTIMVEVLDL